MLAPALAAAELPIFDAHVHYSHDAFENLPPKAAIAILRKAGLRRAVMSSSGDEGTQRLVAEAPDLVIPSLRPYRTRGDMSTWARDESVDVVPRGTPAQQPLRGDRRVPPLRRRRRPAGAETDDRPGQAAQAHPPRALGRRRDRAHVPAGSGRAHPLGALRLRSSRRRSRHAAQAPEPVVRSCVPQRARRGRQGAGRMARGVHRISRPVHRGHRHLHARALALRRRARELVARVARRPAAAAGRAHRMAQRRGAVRVLEAAPPPNEVRAHRRVGCDDPACGQLAAQACGDGSATSAPSRTPLHDRLPDRAGRDRDRPSLRRRFHGVSARRRPCPARCVSMRACPSIGTA